MGLPAHDPPLLGITRDWLTRHDEALRQAARVHRVILETGDGNAHVLKIVDVQQTPDGLVLYVK